MEVAFSSPVDVKLVGALHQLGLSSEITAVFVKGGAFAASRNEVRARAATCPSAREPPCLSFGSPLLPRQE